MQNHIIRQKQLLRRKPNEEILENIIKSFGLDHLGDERWFSKETMEKTNTVEKMRPIAKQLMNYYLPCKARNYLHIVTDKICITIFRQILREFGYHLESKEMYKQKRKYMLYRIEPNVDDLSLVRSLSSRSPSPSHRSSESFGSTED